MKDQFIIHLKMWENLRFHSLIQQTAVVFITTELRNALIINKLKTTISCMLYVRYEEKKCFSC